MWVFIKILIIIFFVVIFKYPGALVRYIFSDKTKSYNEILNEDKGLNASIGFIILFFILIIVIFIIEIFRPDFDWFFFIVS